MGARRKTCGIMQETPRKLEVVCNTTTNVATPPRRRSLGVFYQESRKRLELHISANGSRRRSLGALLQDSRRKIELLKWVTTNRCSIYF